MIAEYTNVQLVKKVGGHRFPTHASAPPFPHPSPAAPVCLALLATTLPSAMLVCMSVIRLPLPTAVASSPTDTTPLLCRPPFDAFPGFFTGCACCTSRTLPPCIQPSSTTAPPPPRPHLLSGATVHVLCTPLTPRLSLSAQPAITAPFVPVFGSKIDTGTACLPAGTNR
ncbi:hypothetical protein B0H14DRAFT_3462522 [Mycena olivaceomarginata]|nr:hypothetical protein B0H14DRAFT_3462522 [Mycena olivaceomarginata]